MREMARQPEARQVVGEVGRWRAVGRVGQVGGARKSLRCAICSKQACAQSVPRKRASALVPWKVEGGVRCMARCVRPVCCRRCEATRGMNVCVWGVGWVRTVVGHGKGSMRAP